MRATNIILLLQICYATTQAQHIPIVDDFAKFEKEYLQRQDDSVIVLNFWATWCKPCVKELPYFAALDSIYAGKPLKTRLLSLDYVKKSNKTLQMFVKKNRIKTDLAFFHMGDPNVWIDKISPLWSGSIPATLIVTKYGNHFFEQEFQSQEELNTIIDLLLIKPSNK